MLDTGNSPYTIMSTLANTHLTETRQATTCLPSGLRDRATCYGYGKAAEE
jgi:hypothetical protein